ncbi:MAG: peptide-methionine (S)-S-oxide reductase [Lysobacteraceae bacterium SCN 69-123]|uniref:peptide-methionine (S)-S-oxide reductase MsrA n=1 Tax=Stenotrophomonas acidaminiphila TaxID=128780 RepID=UPI00086B609B|nr:peptide-methionine (S)-S-oxide reductase MsrA [Stenotrophomonas acidaminiphila]MBN8801563.1 peptide-methionine (S)-S-oxide reductase MsrA [Stenotrophomonas acidaminiphila]MDF9442921.1 peptide-methionine (S)-S-oxide reductase [Stenotrophomonas acidaminiphila]ODU40982.1 MAG: peptide-methionine (S)-S-oxide reductase [Xanthomonadaceae bacterium SCN 69-123]OJY74239.1 MAG: peptide-methionine (S)-S-oxide reductase [Stenotrophomonas sp. 69-14]
MTMRMEKWVAGGIAALVAGLLVLAASGLGRPVHAAPASVDVPVPTGAADLRQPGVHRAQVVFAGGCFWGVQGVFQHVRGVDSAVSGYIGGSAADARYPRVSGGGTGHAEAVQVTYDPSRVSLAQLLQVFFSVVHDPTQRDRQGPDRGSQYRSAVHADDAAQRAATLAYIDQLQRSGVFAAPVVTRVEGGRRFYPAEDYHQNYLALHPDAAYIRFYDLPKVEALQQRYPALYRDAPRLVMPVSVR